MIRSCYNKGVHLGFINGVVVSIQFGLGNHCLNIDGTSNNRLSSIAELMIQKDNGAQAQNAEVAIWIGEEERSITHLYTGFADECDNAYIENVSMEQLVDILIWARNFKI